MGVLDERHAREHPFGAYRRPVSSQEWRRGVRNAPGRRAGKSEGRNGCRQVRLSDRQILPLVLELGVNDGR